MAGRRTTSGTCATARRNGPSSTDIWARGCCRTVHGRPAYDERHLCHSPQERLFIDGHWREGLLPPVDALPPSEQATTLAQYRRFAERVATIARGDAFTIPTSRSTWRAELDALD